MFQRFSVLIGVEQDSAEGQGDGHLRISTGGGFRILPCLLNGIQRVREPMIIEMYPGNDMIGTSKVESVPQP